MVLCIANAMEKVFWKLSVQIMRNLFIKEDIDKGT